MHGHRCGTLLIIGISLGTGDHWRCGGRDVIREATFSGPTIRRLVQTRFALWHGPCFIASEGDVFWPPFFWAFFASRGLFPVGGRLARPKNHPSLRPVRIPIFLNTLDPAAVSGTTVTWGAITP